MVDNTVLVIPKQRIKKISQNKHEFVSTPKISPLSSTNNIINNGINSNDFIKQLNSQFHTPNQMKINNLMNAKKISFKKRSPKKVINNYFPKTLHSCQRN